MHNLFLNFIDVVLRPDFRIYPQHKMTTYQNRFAELGCEFRLFDPKGGTQNILDNNSQLGVVAIPGNIDQTVKKLAVDVLAHKQPGVRALLDPVNRRRRGV